VDLTGAVQTALSAAPTLGIVEQCSSLPAAEEHQPFGRRPDPVPIQFVSEPLGRRLDYA
jgi:hypothetical protein